jgi:hypothetical protein
MPKPTGKMFNFFPQGVFISLDLPEQTTDLFVTVILGV